MERQPTPLLDLRKNRYNATSGPLRLGELLIATGYISREQLDEALRKQTRSHKKLGEVLIDEGYVRPSLVRYGICLQKMLLGPVLAAILSLGMNATSFALSAKFQWDPNTESDLAGYKLHYGVRGEAATQQLDVGLLTTAAVSGLDPDKTYDFVVTAYNTSELESSSSNVVTVLESMAFDAAGNAAVSTVSLTVANDVTPPIVSHTYPVQGSSLRGAVTVSCNASDDVGVGLVEFYVNGAMVAAVNTAPYNYVWDTTTVANGSYTLTAKAYDAAGNVGQAGNLLVSVLNAAPSAPLNISHALQALQIAVGMLSPTDAQKIQLDMSPYINGESVPDGKIDVGDALVIILKITGKIK